MGNNRQTEAQSTLQIARVFCGTSSIAKLSLLLILIVGLVTCYPVCRLRLALVNYAPPPERMRQTIRIKQSRLVIHPRHKTPFIQTRTIKVKVAIKNSRRINK